MMQKLHFQHILTDAANTYHNLFLQIQQNIYAGQFNLAEFATIMFNTLQKTKYIYIIYSHDKVALAQTLKLASGD